MGDDELLWYIRGDRDAPSKSPSKLILDDYYRRKPYKEVVLAKRWDESTEFVLKKNKSLSARRRLYLEKLLVAYFNLILPERLSPNSLTMHLVRFS